MYELLDQYLIYNFNNNGNYYLTYPGFAKKKIRRNEDGQKTMKQMELVPDGTLNLFYEDDDLNKVNNILLKRQVR